GLLLLGKLLFGWNHHQRSWGDKWNRGREWKARFKEKMATMTPEEREKMREQLSNRCRSGFGRWQKEEWDDFKKEEKETH
ncbi:hypothetical protein ACDQ55_00005, partial [Chitinophaga sp. 30R24]